VVLTRGNWPGCTHGQEASLYITEEAVYLQLLSNTISIKNPAQPAALLMLWRGSLGADWWGDVTLVLEGAVHYVISAGVTWSKRSSYRLGKNTINIRKIGGFWWCLRHCPCFCQRHWLEQRVSDLWLLGYVSEYYMMGGLLTYLVLVVSSFCLPLCHACCNRPWPLASLPPSCLGIDRGQEMRPKTVDETDYLI
jgi:hypothetical protein